MRIIKVKDLLELVDGLREKGYDVDQMDLVVGDEFNYKDPVWAFQVLEKEILLEV
jgi:hypothetical protein